MLNSKTTTNARVARWALSLAQYEYEIVHRKGSLHVDVDALSRAPVNNINLSSSSRVVPIDSENWIETYDDDESDLFFIKGEALEDEFHIENGLIYRSNKLFVPIAKRKEILYESHSSTFSAHDGINATVERLKYFWWPNMEIDVRKYVMSCEQCQLRKQDLSKTKGMMRSHVATKPMQMVAADYIGPLLETLEKKKFVIILIDVFSKMKDAKAVKDQQAERFSNFFLNFCGRFGPPEIFISDNAKTFDNKSFNNLLEQLNVTHKITPLGHSQGNGVCERVIGSFNAKVATVINDTKFRLNWEEAIPMVLLTLNSKKHSTTGYTPFEIVFGRQAPLIQRGLRIESKIYILHNEILSKTLEQIRANTIANTFNAQNRAKRMYDENKREEIFNEGEKVLIEVKSRSAKLANKYDGPFVVTNREKDIYELERESNRKDKRRRHISQLKKYVYIAIMSLMVIFNSIQVTLAVGPTLEETLPIFWEEETDHFVSQGEETIR